MRHPDESILIAYGDGSAPADHRAHITGCERCLERVRRLSETANLASRTAEELAASTPASLEARIEWRLRAVEAMESHGSHSVPGSALETSSGDRRSGDLGSYTGQQLEPDSGPQQAGDLGPYTDQQLEPDSRHQRPRPHVGATTLRSESGASWLAALWTRHRALALSGGAVVALVAVALLLGLPSRTVSAAELLQRTQTSLLQLAPADAAIRIVYAIRYSGPDFGVLPIMNGTYRVEEMWDRTQPGSFRLKLEAPDGTLVRGISQYGDRRRIVALTPGGPIDMRFKLDAASRQGHNSLERRQRALARTMFDLLLRAVEPERLSHVQVDDSHVIDLGPRTRALDGLDGLAELERARIVVDAKTYRVDSAALEGRFLGESLSLDIAIESVELLAGQSLGGQDFELGTLADAFVIEGPGTAHPIADAARLLLAQARDHHFTISK